MNEKDKQAAEALAILMPSKPKPKTASQLAWGFLGIFVAFLAAAVVFGFVIMSCWNNLGHVTHLPDITFHQGVAAWVLVWIAGVTLNAGKR